MILLLVFLVSNAPGAQAQVNLSRGSLRLKGAFTRTLDEDVLLHQPTGRRVDLKHLGPRAQALCPHLLVAQHTILDEARVPLPGLEDEFETENDLKAARAYNAITLNVERETLHVRFNPFLYDTLFTVWPRPSSPLGRPEIGLARAISNLVELAAAVARDLDGVTEPREQSMVVVGKLEDTGDMAVDSYSFHLKSIFPSTHFLTVIRGEVLDLNGMMVIMTPHGRYLKLVKAPPMAGSEPLRLAERFDTSLVKLETVLAGIEVNNELRIFTKD